MMKNNSYKHLETLFERYPLLRNINESIIDATNIMIDSFKNGNIDRIIHPLEMFLYNSGWGCAAYCELRKDLRHFELKRINEIELLEEKL